MPPLFWLAATTALAASPAPARWLQVGAMAPYGVQPGLSATATTDLHTWSGRRRRGAFAVGPTVTAFGRPHNHVSGLLGATARVRWTDAETGGFVSLDGGLADWLAARVTSVSVDLGSGDLDRTRVLQHHVVPTLGVSFGRSRGAVGWYGGVHAGRHLSRHSPDSLWTHLEAGVRIGGAR